MQNRLRLLLPLFVLASMWFLGWFRYDTITLHLIGDSTMADKPIIENPERGWGQMLPLFFDGSVLVRNHARNGRSSKSFIDEGQWDHVLNELKAGDYVLIQFGHNDAKKTDSTRFADASTYKRNLLRFVREARLKGAVPVLITPVHRRKFDANGKIADQHGEYPVVVREIARDENVPLIDLHLKSQKFFERMGAEKTKDLFLWIKPGLFTALPQGKEDNTHFTKYGALEIAGLVVEGIKENHLAIQSSIEPIEIESLVGLGKSVLLDYFFNCEWKMVDSSKVQFHYVWEDTANSGFSEIGKSIDELGASILELHRAPSREDLRRASIYVIVDPDTPAETEHPNVIDDVTANVIEEWVRDGGVLVLMGNDKGNAEFERLNKLAERFGIHFNEDSQHQVKGRDFDMGKIAELPQHPIFRNVRQIYLKEISTLRIQKPATAILKEKDTVVMASSRYGRGLVFAVGDPWLYNEYFDTRKLPREFENDKAGKALFTWLLQQALPLEGSAK